MAYKCCRTSGEGNTAEAQPRPKLEQHNGGGFFPGRDGSMHATIIPGIFMVSVGVNCLRASSMTFTSPAFLHNISSELAVNGASYSAAVRTEDAMRAAETY